MYFEGTVDSVNSLGMQAATFVGSYSGSANALVLQWTSGRLRGYRRQLTNFTSEGALQWNTPLAELPSAGDSFIIVGPHQTITTNPQPTTMIETSGATVNVGPVDGSAVIYSGISTEHVVVLKVAAYAAADRYDIEIYDGPISDVGHAPFVTVERKLIFWMEWSLLFQQRQFHL